ncbi:aryl-alcohol dehydrogenase-like predicted oxidoreductase [Paenibacillus endophyticus]|uniref:Aryl-alcohol dehydrogenase-like predicted oxidoreductase n=1 Tax=Paenibacillus endophyticus TaxID=1294268 RepID=A0A7W5GAE7_9BACL|nr:aldo/keto reductase [Paenibacillus endophyticus]MBB3152258.1 aryl-alcohol dehydrogenase-like predicted oxidoreductase [Paenibacillus endophyticus]
MQTRNLGNSDLNPSILGFGAWAAGRTGWGDVDDSETEAAIRQAFDLGITFYDTAPVYGHGHSEELLGRVLKPIRQHIILATKTGLVWNDQGQWSVNVTKANIIREAEESLKRLNTDYIDLYQVNWPDPSGKTPVEETFDALNQLVADAKIRYIGVSNFSVQQLVAAQSVSSIVSLQQPYNLFQRDVEHASLPYTKQQNIGFIPYSPLAQGLLAGKFNYLTRLPKTDVRAQLNPLYSEKQFIKNLVIIETFTGIARSLGKPINEVAINWLLYRKEISSVITGVRTPKQIKENAAAAKWSLSREDYEQISRLFETDSSYVI